MQTWTFALQTIFYYIFHLRTDPTWTEYWLCRMFFICSFFFACFFRNASNMPGIQIPGNLIFSSIISYQRWFTCFVFWCPIFIIFVKMFCFFDTCCMFLMHILYMLCHFFIGNSISLNAILWKNYTAMRFSCWNSSQFQICGVISQMYNHHFYLF